jgi:AcrR family transcriptional regulator
MNEALVLERSRGIGGLGELLTFVGLPSKRSARDLSASSDEMLKGITDVLDQILLGAIEKRTSAEFAAARQAAFADYFRLITAMSSLVRVIVPVRSLEKLVRESLCELEADFRDQGLTKFGTDARDQAMFTVWALRKISRLISLIHDAGPVPENLRTDDAKLAIEFSFYAAWTQFHLDCLLASIRFEKPIHPDVLTDIREGLRAAVNAYGLIRQGVDLRARPEDPIMTPYVWDEEDQALLDSSMSDMEREAL